MSAEGMIYPGEFISLFEKNGFIIQLDLWVFEEVCLRIRAWLDARLTPGKSIGELLPRAAQKSLFLERYIEICQRCGTPPQYIEIELTENVVFEDVGKLSKIIDAIHAAGFGCAMDDFGSGYSSLNLIQNIPVDTIMLDKGLLPQWSVGHKAHQIRGGEHPRHVPLAGHDHRGRRRGRTRSGGHAQASGMRLYQGYYFAKPMPIPDFERLAFGAALKDDPEETKAIMIGIRIIFCLFLLALSSACEQPDSAS